MLTTTLVGAALVVGAPVQAEPETSGRLTQKDGTAGCVSETGSGGLCVDGRALEEMNDLAISPDGKNLYATPRADGALVVFDRDPTTGQLTQKAGTAGCISEDGTDGEGGSCQDGVALNNLYDVAVSPDGLHVYAASFNDDSVAVFDRNATTGELTQKAGTAGCIARNGLGGTCTVGRGLDVARTLAFSPSGKRLYVGTFRGRIALLTRDVDGTLTQPAGTAACISEDATDGDGGTCADGRVMDKIDALAVTADEQNLYAASGDDTINPTTTHGVLVFDIDGGDGSLTQKAGTAGCLTDTGNSGTCTDAIELNDPRDLVVSPDDERVYVAARGDRAIAVLDRDNDGTLTQASDGTGCISWFWPVGCTRLDGSFRPFELLVSPDGDNLYAAGSDFGGVMLLSFDRHAGTGHLTTPGRTDYCVSSEADDIGGVPCSSARLVGLTALATDPNGQNVYVADFFNNAIAILDRTSCASHPFTDVPNWIDAATIWVSCRSFMTGYNDGTFRPDLSITRAQVARLLYRVAGSPDVTGLPDHGFTDVPNWVNDAVTWLADNAYMTGYNDNTFRPDLPITRGQVTRATYRVQGSPAGAPPNTYPDVPNWLDPAADWATWDQDGAGPNPPLMTGYNDGTFRPDDDITRAQTTRLTCRANTAPGTC